MHEVAAIIHKFFSNSLYWLSNIYFTYDYIDEKVQIMRDYSLEIQKKNLFFYSDDASNKNTENDISLSFIILGLISKWNKKNIFAVMVMNKVCLDIKYNKWLREQRS